MIVGKIEKINVEAELENGWDALHRSINEVPKLQTFDDRWEEVICDTANYLKYMRYFPDSSFHHNVPVDWLKRFYDCYELNKWDDDGYTEGQIISCAGRMRERHLWFLMSFLDGFRERMKGGDELDEQAFIIVTIGKAISLVAEDFDDKNIYYRYNYKAL